MVKLGPGDMNDGMQQCVHITVLKYYLSMQASASMQKPEYETSKRTRYHSEHRYNGEETKRVVVVLTERPTKDPRGWSQVPPTTVNVRIMACI